MANSYIEEFIEHGVAKHGDKFEVSDLDFRFGRYYWSKERIKVKDSSGKIAYGTVGMTTGWKPAFLLMRNIRTIGSSVLLNSTYEIIGVQQKGFKKYSNPY